MRWSSARACHSAPGMMGRSWERLPGAGSGRAIPAPIDNVMSPTYIPDLVHAVLDLLIDKESGVWHLVNEGAVTWFDLARGAARRTGRAINHIVPVEASSIWSPAARPPFSALSSQRARIMRPLDAALMHLRSRGRASHRRSGRTNAYRSRKLVDGNRWLPT